MKTHTREDYLRSIDHGVAWLQQAAAGGAEWSDPAERARAAHDPCSTLIASTAR